MWAAGFPRVEQGNSIDADGWEVAPAQDESGGDDAPMEIDDDAELSALMQTSWHANDAKE